MADMTLEEALAAATVDEELVMPVNEVLMINPETRIINVPDSEKLFGARQDVDAERKYFKCPRIVGDNIDLSEHHIYVSYVPSRLDGTYNETEEVGGYLCEDLTIDGDYVAFSWLLSGNVFQKAGYIAFAVFAKQADENGDLKTKWHTSVAVGNVLDTLPDGNQIIERYPDVIEQIVKRMDSLTQISPEDIATAVSDYMESNPGTSVSYESQNLTDSQKEQARENIGAESSGAAAVEITGHNTNTDAHNDIRLLIAGLTSRLNVLADSDDTTLDQMSEVVTYIKSNKGLIDAITTSKVSVSDIIDNLTTNASNKPLSAAQGVILKKLIDAIVVPNTLPNPQKLTFTGAVAAEYDGSGAVTVTIPDGSIERIEKFSTDTEVDLQPNKLYIFPEMESLSVTLAKPSKTDIVNEYHFVFQSGTTATTLTIPDTVNIPSSLTVDANKIYEISIMENCLAYQSWEITA